MSLTLNFAELWQQDELSDVTLVLQAPGEPMELEEEASYGPTVLRRLPAHRVLLATSPYFKAQIQRWGQPGDTAGSSSSSNSVTLTLSSASDESSAMAVLEALYGTRPVPDILAGLAPEQQLEAVVLADMLQIPNLSKAALDHVLTQCDLSGPYAAAVASHLADMHHISEDLLLLAPAVFKHYDTAAAEADGALFDPCAVQRLAVELFGDLELALTDRLSHQEGLFTLPRMYELPVSVAMLLFAADDLRVSSEDVVASVANDYMHALCMRRCDRAEIDKARAELPALIRAPQLSRFWLLTALTTTNDRYILGSSSLRPSLVGLVSLLLGTATDSSSSSSRLGAEQLQRLLPDCPESWLKGPRLIQPAKPLVLTKSVTNGVTFLRDYANNVLTERWGGSENPFTARVVVHGDGRPGGCDWSPGFTFTKGHWNDAAWAAKGLPTEGELVLQVTVSNVGHASQLSTVTVAADGGADTASGPGDAAAAAAKEEERSAGGGLAAAEDTAVARDQ